MKGKICAVPEPVPDESSEEPSPNSSEMPQPVQPDLPIRWYALWVYRGLTGPVIKQCENREIPFYRPMRLVEDFAGEKLAYNE